MVGRLWPAFLLLAACGGESSETTPITSPGCPVGQIASGDGCVAVGIQSCADIFAGEDGLCRPSIDSCPAGSIPKFGEGCVAVGIADCPVEFLEPDGICHPSMHKCPTGTFAVPTVGCVALDDCGSGTWGNITDATIWVDPTFVGGNGTMQQPFATIADALAVATPGSRIALAAGDYDEPVALDMPIELIGRCPSMVSIRGAQTTPGGDVPVIVFIDGAQDVRVSGVRLSGAGMGVFVLESQATLSRMHVDRVTGAGVLAASSTVALERMLIEHTLEQQDGYGGSGVYLHYDAQASIHQSALFQNRGTGLSAAMSAALTMRESLVEESLPNTTNFSRGVGISVEGGVSLQIESSAFVANSNVGIVLHEAGTNAMVSDSLIEKTLPDEEYLDYGYGLAVQSGSAITVEGSAILDNRGLAMLVTEMGTAAKVSGSLLARTQSHRPELMHGMGIAVQWGASLTLDESTIVDSRSAGVGVFSSEPEMPSSAIITESLIERTLPQESDGTYGFGIAVGYGHLALSNSVVRQARTAGVIVGGVSSAEIVTSSVEETRSGQYFDLETETVQRGIGYGIAILFATSANLTDTAVHRADQAAVIYDSSPGVLRGVRTSESPIGLVLQGQPHPDWQHDSNSFEGGVLEDGTLPVPGEPP